MPTAYEITKKRLEDTMDHFLAAMAGLLNRKQLDVNNYLHAENEIVRLTLDKVSAMTKAKVGE